MSLLQRLRPPSARQGAHEDGVALLMVLAYIGIFTSLMLAMLAIVIGQVKPTAQARKDVGSLNAASSGLQVALTALRTATDTKSDGTAGAGNRGRLPCTPGGTTRFTEAGVTKNTPGARTKGVASSLPGNFQYEYSVAYYLDDPTDKNPVWLAANAMTCPLPKTPLYAYIQSYGVGDAVVGGTASRGNRSQSGVYKFSVPTENIAGGPIRARDNRALCWDAGATPGLGSALTLQSCTEPAQARQLFVYRTDLSLFYGGNPTLNLCIEATSSKAPSLRTCSGVGVGNTYPYATSVPQQAQSWSYNNGGAFSAADDNGNASGTCLGPASNAIGAAILRGNYCNAMDPDPAVGAGKAGGNITGRPGAPTQQFVNFEQFGRCLDVTGGNFSTGFLIAYPCKQAPNSATLSWNQLWQFLPVTGNTGTLYTTPRSGDNQNGVSPAGYLNTRICITAVSASAYVTGTPCLSSQPAEQQWTATGIVQDSPKTSYNMVSKAFGTCLSLSSAADGYTAGIRKITVEACNGSARQRWNAPPPPPVSGLDAIREGSSISQLN